SAGYDWLLIRLEHGAATEAALLCPIQGVDVRGGAALVRPQSGQRIRIGPARGMGRPWVRAPGLASAGHAPPAVTPPRNPTVRRRRRLRRGAGGAVSGGGSLVSHPAARSAPRR